MGLDGTLHCSGNWQREFPARTAYNAEEPLIPGIWKAHFDECSNLRIIVLVNDTRVQFGENPIPADDFAGRAPLLDVGPR